MSFDTVRASAETILSNWGGLPVAFDNVPFDSKAYPQWCRVTVIDGDRFEAAVGSTCIRSVGLVVIQVFTAQGEGSANARILSTRIASLFSGKVDGDVTYRAPTITREGHALDFYQMNVDVAYQYDEHYIPFDPVTHLGVIVTHNAETVTHNA